MNCYRGVTKGCPTVLRIHILNPDPAKNLNLDPDPRHCHIYNVDILTISYLDPDPRHCHIYNVDITF